jgi:hypothetical protein
LSPFVARMAPNQISQRLHCVFRGMSQSHKAQFTVFAH